MRHLSEALSSSLTLLTPILPALALATACAAPPPEPEPSDAVAYEGGRIIVGNGNIIENGTLLVEEGRLAAVGEADTVEVPAGAERVDLTGRTIMPAIIDTHVHLREPRDELIDDLQRKAYYGVGVVLSLGRGASDTAFEMRNETLPNAARYRTVGRGITGPEPGRTEVPYWVTTEEEAREAVRELATQNVDWVKIWVDERNGQVEKLPAELYGAVIDEAHQQGLRVTAHVYTLEDAKGLLRAGLDAFAHGIRDMDIDDEVVELFRERPHVLLGPQPARPRGCHRLELAERHDPARPARGDAGAVGRSSGDARGVRYPGSKSGSLGGRGGHYCVRHRRERRMEPARRDGRHGASRDGHRPTCWWPPPGTRRHWSRSMMLGRWRPRRVPTSSCSKRNPLDDITNTRQIVDVYLRGEPVDRAGLSAKWLGRGDAVGRYPSGSANT